MNWRVHFKNKKDGCPCGWLTIVADNEEQAKLKFYNIYRDKPYLTISMVESLR